jgi:hypothetical protein
VALGLTAFPATLILGEIAASEGDYTLSFIRQLVMSMVCGAVVGLNLGRAAFVPWLVGLGSTWGAVAVVGELFLRDKLQHPMTPVVILTYVLASVTACFLVGSIRDRVRGADGHGAGLTNDVPPLGPSA